MKNIKNKILISIVSIYLLNLSTFAKNKTKKATPDTLLPKPDKDISKAASNLPDVSVANLISDIIKQILTWTFTISVIALIVAGFYYLTSQGDEEKSTKAKDVIKYLIAGLLVISAAYGIVSGIAAFDFFKTKI